MVAADVGISMACLFVAFGIVEFNRRSANVKSARIGFLLAGLIAASGLTRLMDVWTIWQADYALQAVVKAVNATVILAAAFAVWRLVPRVARMASPGGIQAAAHALELEVGKRRRAEENAANIEESLALTLASIDAGMITTDLMGNVVRMNAVAERITGWTCQDAMGRSYFDVCVLVDRPAYPAGANMVEVMAQFGYTVEKIHRMTARSREGLLTPVEINVSLTRTEDGAIRGMLAVLKDMSSASRAEEDMRRLAAIVESSSDAIIGKTLDGRITAWNRGACALFGYTAEEALGRSVRMLIPDDRLPEEMEILANIIDGRIVPPFDTIRLAKGNRPIALSVTISPIRDGKWPNRRRFEDRAGHFCTTANAGVAPRRRGSTPIRAGSGPDRRLASRHEDGYRPPFDPARSMLRLRRTPTRLEHRHDVRACAPSGA